MIEGAIFLSAAIIAVTQALKELFPDNINGAITVGVSVLLGILVAVLDKEIGIADLSIAQGILIALAGSGTVTVAQKVKV